MSGTDALALGTRCVAASRALLWVPGDPPSPSALELKWSDGSVTVFDTRPDWTLSVSPQPWRDPFDGVDVDDPSWDLGEWTKESIAASDPIALVVGEVLISSTPRFNEVGEFVGLDLQFESALLQLGVWGGDLRIQALQGSEDPTDRIP